MGEGDGGWKLIEATLNRISITAKSYWNSIEFKFETTFVIAFNSRLNSQYNHIKLVCEITLKSHLSSHLKSPWHRLGFASEIALTSLWNRSWNRVETTFEIKLKSLSFEIKLEIAFEITLKSFEITFEFAFEIVSKSLWNRFEIAWESS